MRFADFVRDFVRLPDPRTRALVPMALHAEQEKIVKAVDARDAQTGLRVHREIIVSHPKKFGKSTLAGAAAVWGLVGDDLHDDREIIIAACDLAQSRDAVFLAATRIVQRNAWLRKHVKVGATEMVFREIVTDPRTGGRYAQSHVLRAVPRDVRGLHGLSPSLLIFDEVWNQDSYELIEALAPSPARRSPLTWFTSYAGLRSQGHEGHPWFDLLARAGDDPTLFCSHVHGPEVWRQVPWITEAWINQMRRTFATVPSKYQRLVENEWASGDSALLTTEELRDAVDASLVEPTTGEKGVSYVIGLDLGITFDWTALVLAHVDGRSHKLVVDIVRTWRGTRNAPVSLMEVENTVAALCGQFKVSKVIIDQWQATLLVERLRGRAVPVEPVTIEPARLDTLTTMLKGTFSRRMIRIPAREHEFLEQLESLQVVEAGARNARRDRLRFQPGGTKGAAAHDDLAIALSLCIEQAGAAIGRPTLPPDFTRCYKAANVKSFRSSACYLFSSLSYGYLPQGDAACAACAGHQFVMEQYREYLEQGYPAIGLREYRKSFLGENTITEAHKWHVLAGQFADRFL